MILGVAFHRRLYSTAIGTIFVLTTSALYISETYHGNLILKYVYRCVAMHDLQEYIMGPFVCIRSNLESRSIGIMQLRFIAALLLVALLMCQGYLAASVREVDSDSDELHQSARGGIDLPCTVDCAKWWRCRIMGFFIKRCTKPAGCNCSEFVWEG